MFNTERKGILADYLKTVCKIFHGRISLQTCQFAFEAAASNFLKMPSTWTEN